MEIGKNQKQKEIVQHIRDNKSLVKDFIKIYNKLCPKCRSKLLVHTQRNMVMDYTQFCPKCKEVAEKILI